MRQRRADEVIFVENCGMLDLIFEIHQDCILDELRLQETLLIDWTVKDALKAQIPKEVVDVVFREEVLLEIASEVGQLVPPQVHGLLFCVPLDALFDRPMEEKKILIVLLDNLF